MDNRDIGIALMKQSRFVEAAVYFKRALAGNNHDDGLLYMTGQCARFQNNYEEAICYLKQAVAINRTCMQYILALGIALQMSGRYKEAIEVLNQGIDAKNPYPLLLNSLGLTRKMMGEYDKAIHCYNECASSMVKQVVMGMGDSKPALQSKPFNSRHSIWLKYAIDAAIWLIAINKEEIGLIAFPDNNTPADIHNSGQYWTDSKTIDGKTVRMLLPNYFHTISASLLNDKLYATVMGNISEVYAQIVDIENANLHSEEMEDFS